MPSDMKLEWVKVIACEETLKNDVKFKSLMKLLERWRYRLEYLNDSNRMSISTL